MSSAGKPGCMLLEVVVELGTLDEVEVGWVLVLVGLTLVLAG